LSENNFIGTWTFSSLADFMAGMPAQFRRNTGDPSLDVKQFEFASFIQNDWRVSPKFNLSFGLRYEGQTNIGDNNNLDPRMGFGYQLGRTTVLRGGAGIFHQRFEQNNLAQLLRLDGTRQLEVVVRNPTTYPNIPEGAALPPASLRVRAGD
jgi:outer membrane receptor for ferrienterochelin and colicin